MQSRHWPRKLAATTVLCVVSLAQTPRPGESSLELEPSLYVQLPGGKSPAGSVHLVWIPEPLVKYCLGTTTNNARPWIIVFGPRARTCPRAVTWPWTHLPAYPSDMRPRRVLSVVLFPPNRMKGWDELQDYIARAPKDRLEHFSPPARIKAKVAFTRTPDDDGLQVLEIVSVPGL